MRGSWQHALFESRIRRRTPRESRALDGGMAAKAKAAEHRDAAFGHDADALNAWRARKPWESE